MTKVAAGEKETVIKVGTGITIGVRNEGPYRINWANVDGIRYVHREIYDNLDTKKKELAKKLKNIRENYGKLEEEWINEKNEKKRWKKKLVVTNTIWLFAILLILLFI